MLTCCKSDCIVKSIYYTIMTRSPPTLLITSIYLWCWLEKGHWPITQVFVTSSNMTLDIESSEKFKSRLTKLYYGGWTTWTKDDDFILILITCKYTHFWDFTVYTNNFVMLEDVTNTWVLNKFC
jgi:hypothetical protein